MAAKASPFKSAIPLNDLPLADLMLWLNDNQLPSGSTFLLPGSVGQTTIMPEVWKPLPYAAGFSDLGGGFAAGQYAVDSLGFVHLRGLIQHPGAYAYGATICTLPAGARPALTETYEKFMLDATTGNAVARIDVGASGAVILQASVPTVSGSGLTRLSLSGITFKQA